MSASYINSNVVGRGINGRVLLSLSPTDSQSKRSQNSKHVLMLLMIDEGVNQLLSYTTHGTITLQAYAARVKDSSDCFEHLSDHSVFCLQYK